MLVWGIIAAILCWLLYHQFSLRFLQPLALKQINQITAGRARIGSVQLRLNASVVLKNVTIASCENTESENIPFQAKTIVAKFSLPGVFTLKPKLKKLTVRDFVLNAVYDSDTTSWNAWSAELILRVVKSRAYAKGA